MTKILKSSKEVSKNKNISKEKQKTKKNNVKTTSSVNQTPDKAILKKKSLKKALILSKELSQNVDKPIKEKKKSKKGKTTTKTNEEQKLTTEDEELHEPTAEELLESEKPENVKNIVTVRQKKKQKHLQRLEEKKNQLPNKEIAKNEEYLEKWKNNRSEWKFEKLRQVSIQLSMFDDSKISKTYWPIALEYLSASKGAAKDKITKAAEEVIDELDKKAENMTDEESTTITSSEKYRRARELLQSFD